MFKKLEKKDFVCSPRFFLKFGSGIYLHIVLYKMVSSYRTCQLNVPLEKILETLRTGQFFIISSPYMMTAIRKKQHFVILSGTY